MRTQIAQSRSLAYVFLGVVMLQAFHNVEHVAQIIQKFVLELNKAHGLIGQLDLELVHLAYNSVYFIILVFLVFGYGFRKRESWLEVRSSFYHGFLGAFGLQGYHVVEYIVKTIQYIQTGIQGTPGILGNFVNLVLATFLDKYRRFHTCTCSISGFEAP